MEQTGFNTYRSFDRKSPLYENLAAYENLKVRTILLRLPEQCIYEVLEIVDLQNTGKKKAGQFSMGMKQRLGIAVALLNNPSLLILDEPTNGLDPIGLDMEVKCSKAKPLRDCFLRLLKEAGW